MTNDSGTPLKIRTELREKLARHFSKEELRTLCFDLGIQYENLPDSPEGMARDLVAHCERDVTIPKLLSLCRKRRPNVTWPQWPPLTEKVKSRVPEILRDSIWQGIGAVAAILALVFVIIIWIVPALNPAPKPTATLSPSPSFTPTPTATSTLTLTPAPTRTPIPTPSPTPSHAPTLTPMPTVVIVDTMNSLSGWRMVPEGHSTLNITSIPGMFDQAIEIRYNLQPGSWVIISKDLAPNILTKTNRLRFFYTGAGPSNTIELRLLYETRADGAGEAFSISRNEIVSPDQWVIFEAPYSALSCGNTCTVNGQMLEVERVRKLEIAISHQLGGTPGPGSALIDQIEAIRSLSTLAPEPTRTLVRRQDGAIMVYVPAGNFLMGSEPQLDSSAETDETPQHVVYLDSFWIDRTEATNAQYKQCVLAGVCRRLSYGDEPKYNQGAQPVIGVKWNDAQKYCQWAGAQLPTEAQWEKAARWVDGRLYPWGNQEAACDYAVIRQGDQKACGLGDAPQPVGSQPKDASLYGALDMTGNVWEWVADAYDGSFYSKLPSRDPNPMATVSSRSPEERVIRGGSWLNDYKWARATHRHSMSPTYDNIDLGFRCVSSVPGQ